MPQTDFHLRVHEWSDGALVVSMDLPKHELDGVPAQRDILDELLLMPQPPPPASPVVALEGDEGDDRGGAHGTSDAASLEPTRPATPESAVKRALHLHHRLVTDALIFKYVEVHGPRWRALSRSLGGRATGYTDDAVRNRYMRILKSHGLTYTPSFLRNPDPQRPALPNRAWTPEEDAIILRCLCTHGRQWPYIASLFKGRRTVQAVRNRGNRLTQPSANGFAAPLGEVRREG